MRPEICLSFEEITLAMMFIFSFKVNNMIKKVSNIFSIQYRLKLMLNWRRIGIELELIHTNYMVNTL